MRCDHQLSLSSEAARCERVRGDPWQVVSEKQFVAGHDPTSDVSPHVLRIAAFAGVQQESEACLECHERASDGAVFEDPSCRAGVCYRCSIYGVKEPCCTNVSAFDGLVKRWWRFFFWLLSG